MSPAALATVAAAGFLAWGGLALMVAIAVGRTISRRDTAERPACCPHPESDVPDTVRGEFRAVVIQ